MYVQLRIPYKELLIFQNNELRRHFKKKYFKGKFDYVISELPLKNT